MALVDLEPQRRPGRGSETALRDWVRALETSAPIARQPQRLLPTVIEELAQNRGDAPALLSADASLTYRALAERTNRYARWALAHGVGKGETVGLLMPNRPEYMAIWLGISSIGGVVALLNTNLRAAALAHCIDIVAPKHLIVATELLDAAHSASPHMASEPQIWTHGCGGDDALPRIDLEIERFAPAPLTAAERRGTSIADRA